MAVIRLNTFLIHICHVLEWYFSHYVSHISLTLPDVFLRLSVILVDKAAIRLNTPRSIYFFFYIFSLEYFSYSDDVFRLTDIRGLDVRGLDVRSSGFGVSDVRGSTPNVRKWTFGVFGRSGFGRSGLDPERPN